MKSIKLFMPIVLILLAVSTCYSLPSNWTYTNTGNNHIVLIQPTSVITVNGASLTSGDYIGVFYFDNGNLICGGYIEWTGGITVITAWGDDSYSLNKDGFSIGETFNWKIWSSSLNLEYNATVTYMAGFPNQGTYAINGTSGIATAMSSSSIVVNSTKPSCFGLSDGVINIVVTSGTPPYTYSWSNGATTQNIANVPSGVYGITVTDVSQTSDSLMIGLAQPDLLEASVLVNEDSAFMCMAHAQVFPTGGTAPFFYQWNTIPPQTSQLALLCPGLTTVTITDSHNCQTSAEVVVDATSQNVIDSSFTYMDTCLFTVLPDTAYISNLYFSGGYLLIQWTFGFGSTNLILDTYYPGVTSPGLYYVGLVINCPLKNFPTLTFVDYYELPEMVSFTGLSNETSCPGNCDGSISISISTGTPPFSYQWSTGATTQNISGLCNGTYTLTVTDFIGSSYIESYVVNEPVAMNLSGLSQNLDCNGICNGSIDVTVSGGNPPYSYNWSNGETSEDIVDLCATDYNVQVTDASGCFVSAAYVIIEPGAVVVNSNINEATCSCCNDGSIDISVLGGVSPYTFAWSTNATSEDISSLINGTYELTVTDANSCESSFPFIVTGVLPMVIESNEVSVSCNGLSNGSINCETLGGTTPLDYLWSTGATAASISELAAGSYTVTVTDSLGCEVSTVFEITQPDELEIQETIIHASFAGACDGVITTTITGGTSPYGFTWSNGSNTSTIDYLCAGTYTVTITDYNSCEKTEAFIVEEYISVDFPADNEGFCSIYPNPVYETLFLHFQNNTETLIDIEIYNSIGLLVLRKEYPVNQPKTLEIALPEISSGIYFIRVNLSDGQSNTLRFSQMTYSMER